MDRPGERRSRRREGELDVAGVHESGNSINAEEAGKEITVIGAIVRDIPFEYTVQPRLVAEIEARGGRLD